MSNVALSGNASGTGTFTIASPNSNTDRTLNLPDASGGVVLDSATQTLTNKTIQGGAITSGTAVASTSGTSIDFTSIPSWVRRITVMFSGVSTNGSSERQIQLGDAGGIETTGYSGTRSILVNTSTVSASNLSAGFLLAGTSASDVLHGAAVFTLISTNSWVCSMNGGFSSAAATFNTAGTKTLSDTLDRVRITTVNGTDTFDAGSINILYE